MVSAVLLIMLAMATYPVIDQAGQNAGAQRSRGVASSLAQADQDRMRQMPIANLANLRQTQTKKVDEINYTIQSRADWTRDATGLVTCAADGTKAEYLKISSTVSFSNSANVDPIVVESIVAPGVAALGPNKGALTVKLTGDSGTGTAGVPVSTSGFSDSTDSGGCVVFGNLDAGTKTVTWSRAGYVDRYGNPSVSKSATVTGGATAQISDLYDKAGSVNVRFVDDQSTPAPAAWTSASGTNTGMPSGPRAWTTGSRASSFDALNVFPFSSAYGFYAGSCTGNDPTAYKPGFTLPAATVTPGSTSAIATMTMPLVTVQVNKSSGGGQGAAYLTARPDTTTAQMASCTETMGTGSDRGAIRADATGKAVFALPYGRWTICADDGSSRKITTTSASRIENTPPGAGVNPARSASVTLTLPSATGSGTCP